MQSLDVDLSPRTGFDGPLNHILALAAIEGFSVVIHVSYLRELLDYLTSSYMPGVVCDIARTHYDCFSFTTETPIEWPLPDVRFIVDSGGNNVSADDLVNYSVAYVQSQFWRWAYTEEDPQSIAKANQWEQKHGLWEGFDILKSFQIEISPDPPGRLELWLKSKGFEVMGAGGRCPFQVIANHIKGDFHLYFRARGRTAALRIYDGRYYGPFLPKDERLLWYSRLESWTDPDAGWIDFGEAHYAIALMLSEAVERLDELRESML